jgi:hypothetical protein
MFLNNNLLLCDDMLCGTLRILSASAEATQRRRYGSLRINYLK